MRSKNSRASSSRSGLVGGIDQHGVDAQLGEDFDLPLEPDQRLGGRLGPQDSRRRRIEGEHHGRPAHSLGHRPQPLDQPRMAEVDAVEVADGHGAAAERFGEIVEAAEEVHEVWQEKTKA